MQKAYTIIIETKIIGGIPVDQYPTKSTSPETEKKKTTIKIKVN